MYGTEVVHRYPRALTWSIELLCTVIVALSALNLGAALLRSAWDFFYLDQSLFNRVPLLEQIVGWVFAAPGRVAVDTPADLAPALLPALIWAAVALLLAILLRNALPIVRTSSRGLLVEFANSWLPIPWEHLRSVKVTEDLAAEHFVLLAQTDRQQLTSWHRFYSLIYRLHWQRGFLITSNISEFDKLVKTMVSESDRAARAIEGAKPLKMEEDANSPLFRFLLSPASFFSRRTLSEASAAAGAAAASQAAAPALTSGPISGHYPIRITALITWGTIVVAALAIWQYLLMMSRFLALEIPFLRQVALFSRAFADPRYSELANAYRTVPVPFFGVPGRPDLPAPWWLLVAAHLLLLLMIGVLLVLRNMLPSLEARNEGIAVRDMLNGRWRLVPWNMLSAIKATEFSEQSQVLLLQARSGMLPTSRRFASLLYDGSLEPGVLVTSAISNFQPLIQRALLEITRLQGAGQPASPILQQEAHSRLLMLAFKPGATLDEMVADVRASDETKQVRWPALLRVAAPMFWLALPLAIQALVSATLLSDTAPTLRVLLSAFVLWFAAVLEWPLVSLLSVLLDDATGGGEEGYRALYLYPSSQLPRLLPLLAALVLLLAGVPLAPFLLWLGAIVWSFVLAAGLWEALYGWKGSQSLLGGLIPVIWQLLVLLVFLLFSR